MSENNYISIKGARVNNLKNIDVDIPRNRSPGYPGFVLGNVLTRFGRRKPFLSGRQITLRRPGTPFIILIW